MDKLRLKYSQTGRIVWASHLDVMRTLQRGLNRAGVPIKYSEGFNPHALISIVMPLSVGQASHCQLVDIRVKEDVDVVSLPQKLTEVMPEGLIFTECYEDCAKPAELKWMRISGEWEYDNRDTRAAAAEAEALFSGEVTVHRRTKHGEDEFCLSDHIREIQFAPDSGTVHISALISCNDPVVNPELISAAMRKYLPNWLPDGIRYCRETVYKADGTEFR